MNKNKIKKNNNNDRNKYRLRGWVSCKELKYFFYAWYKFTGKSSETMSENNFLNKYRYYPKFKKFCRLIFFLKKDFTRCEQKKLIFSLDRIWKFLFFNEHILGANEACKIIRVQNEKLYIKKKKFDSKMWNKVKLHECSWY